MDVNSATLATKIVQLMNAQDKNGTDEQIDKSIWNSIIGDKGKNIKNYITTENAIKSVSVYLCREAKKQNKQVNDIGQEWIEQLEAKNNQSNNVIPVKPKTTTHKRSIPKKSISNTRIKRKHSNIRGVDTSYSKLTRANAEKRAEQDSRLERLNGGKGWSVVLKSFVTDIPFARKFTGKILSHVSNFIKEHLFITSALGTKGNGTKKSPHKLTQNYSTHHNAENPKLDIRTNGHAKELEKKLRNTGIFKIINENDHLDVQILPEVYMAIEKGYSMERIQRQLIEKGNLKALIG